MTDFNKLPIAPGYQGLPNGAWSSVIYEKDVLKNFTAQNVTDYITTPQFAGELADFGSEIQICLAPEVTVTEGSIGGKIVRQFLDDQKQTLTLTEILDANFQVDTVQLNRTHIDYVSLASERAAEAIKTAYDKNVLAYIEKTVTEKNIFGNKSSPTAPDYFGNKGVGEALQIGYGMNLTSPINLLLQAEDIFDQNLVPSSNRVAVVDSTFWRFMQKEEGKFIEANTMGMSESVVLKKRQSAAFKGTFCGFDLYVSQNLPTFQNGATRTMLFLHRDATAVAHAISKNRLIELQDTHAVGVDLRFVFGREVLRPDSALTAHVSY